MKFLMLLFNARGVLVQQCHYTVPQLVTFFSLLADADKRELSEEDKHAQVAKHMKEVLDPAMEVCRYSNPENDFKMEILQA